MQENNFYGDQIFNKNYETMYIFTIIFHGKKLFETLFTLNR